MCTAAPQTVNSRGETLSSAVGVDAKYNVSIDPHTKDPVGMSNLLLNWLTGGGPPKKIDPGETFANAEKLSGVTAKAAAGQGIAGLFGAGLVIGDLVPKPLQLSPGGKGGENSASPMQTGVPYSVPPLVKLGGG